jgi:maltooligosyltrehalose trehalohydrolase
VSAPDPQDPATFQRSLLDTTLRQHGQHQTLLAWYTELIRLRKQVPALACVSKSDLEVLSAPDQQCVFVRRWHYTAEVFIVLYFGGEETPVSAPLPSGHWQKIIDAAEEQWQGLGSKLPQRITSAGSVSLDLSPYACVVFCKMTPSEVH